MRDDPSAAEMLDIATSTLPLVQRAHGLLECLGRWLAVEGTWFALSDPSSNVYATGGAEGVDRPVLAFLDGPAVAREIQQGVLAQSQRPVSLTDLPVSSPARSGSADRAGEDPASFRQGLGVPLFEPGGPYLGMLTLLFTSPEEPSAALCNRLRRLAPVISRGVSPMPGLLATAQLVQDARYGVVLLADGTIHPLQGLEDHSLLAGESAVVAIARQALLSGQVYRSFMWPTGDGPTGHARLTVLAASEDPALVLGTLPVTPEVGCRGLTPHELEVLGLLVHGCSNRQIARRLEVTPRTVAAHVEHLLGKLDVATRTSAAVLAEREGCYVPAPP